MRHVIPISGKDSLATAIVQTARDSTPIYEYLHNDTEMELPETYEWLSLVEKTLRIKIVRSGKSLDTVIREQGFLPSFQKRFCTKYSKIFPMRDYIGKRESAVLYIGLRADEDRAGYKAEGSLRVCYPLKELGITLPMVYQIVDSKGLRPPTFFWSRLHQSVCARMGDAAWVIDELPRWLFDRSFAWRSRPNCFNCFYQRRYEWVGLAEHHPDLFARAVNLEREFGAGSFNWIAKDFPLIRIQDEADRIFNARVRAICDFLNKRLQNVLWAEPLIDELDMTQTSCGLLCGK